MYLPNAAHQEGLHRAFRADGTITAGGTPQLILPVAQSRAMVMIMNTSNAVMFLEHGPARFLATITNGTLTAVTITNAGFGYTNAPSLTFKGGGPPFVANAVWSGIGMHSAPTPTGLMPQGDTIAPTYRRPARAHCVLTAGAVTSVVIDDPGAGYVNPPMIIAENNHNDPFGCAVPSATVGICLPAINGFYYINGTTCWMDQMALYGGTTGQTFVCEYMV